MIIINLSFHVGATTTTCMERERQALTEFRKGIYDEFGWLSSWAHISDCCEWEGVFCNNLTGHVAKLDLRADYKERKFLGGNISPNSLTKLSHLEYLDLSFNVFFGSIIPYQLGNLSHLQYLNLSYTLCLSSVGHMKWLFYLNNLQTLDLSYADASEANDWPIIVNGLTKLSILKLTLCDLPSPTISYLNSHVNASKRLLSSLSEITLAGNFLSSSVFRWLSNSTNNVVSLNLFGNQLTGPIPEPFLNNLDVLSHLDLSSNQLEGEIPQSFGNLCSLKSLKLSQNNLKGEILGFVGNLSTCSKPSLESLELSWNQFSDSIPDFSVFSSLKELDLSGNSFTGSLSNSIGDLIDLETLDVSSNNLDNIVSESYLSNLSKLEYLGLSCSYISLSSKWVPPFQLKSLTLKPCKLRGPDYNFPSWLRTQKNITVLDIASLGISDTIPNWLWSIASNENMIYLNLSNNDIRGTLPRLLRNIGRFSTVDLSSNRLEGVLPNFRYANSTMQLDLSDNEFSGSISSFCSSSSASGPKILDLSNNRLSGEIPSHCLSKWSDMTVLNLANNNFSGKIPGSIGSMYRLTALVLRNNSFFGKLPSPMKKCDELTFVDLGYNEISGELPSWIGDKLSNLKILILRSNKLQRNIHWNLCKLQKLQILDLGHNNMSGDIPHCFSNFTAMTRQGNASDEKDMGVSFFEADPIVEMVFEFFLFLLFPKLDLNSAVNQYSDEATLLLKGRDDLYVKKSLLLLRGIDLSNNRFEGNIPNALMNLSALIALNLGSNRLSGTIPSDIGDRLNQLISLDLSRNELSGEIPMSMASMNFLSYLDLSYNNLSGKIPTGTQLQTFNASFYEGNNPALCGPPLTIGCSNDPHHEQDNSSANVVDSVDELFDKWFFVYGAMMGLVAGFWGFWGVLFFNRASRVAYFKFIGRLLRKD